MPAKSFTRCVSKEPSQLSLLRPVPLSDQLNRLPNNTPQRLSLTMPSSGDGNPGMTESRMMNQSTDGSSVLSPGRSPQVEPFQRKRFVQFGTGKKLRGQSTT